MVGGGVALRTAMAEKVWLKQSGAAEMLEDAERSYPVDWLEEAVRIAVENNVRTWRYIDAILRSWKEKGRDEQDRRDSEKNRRRYDEGEFADFIDN